jgi:hypothetical protein
VPDTVAVNCCDCATWTLVLAGEIETDTAVAGMMVTLALAEVMGCTVVWTVTVTGEEGTAVGAL